MNAADCLGLNDDEDDTMEQAMSQLANATELAGSLSEVAGDALAGEKESNSMASEAVAIAKQLQDENASLKSRMAEMDQAFMMVTNQRSHWQSVASNLEIQLELLKAKAK